MPVQIYYGSIKTLIQQISIVSGSASSLDSCNAILSFGILLSLLSCRMIHTPAIYYLLSFLCLSPALSVCTQSSASPSISHNGWLRIPPPAICIQISVSIFSSHSPNPFSKRSTDLWDCYRHWRKTDCSSCGSAHPYYTAKLLLGTASGLQM